MDSVWLGMTETECGIAVPVYVTRLGNSAERQIFGNSGLVPLFSENKEILCRLKYRLF